MGQARFGEVLFLSDRPPPTNVDDAIRWERIDPLRSRADYSRFMLRELAAHIKTNHALCVQWDGYVLNGAAWTPHFLHYDYIGAVWPHFRDSHNVGNGGFSLRSRRLLAACRDLPFDGLEAEDVVIGRICRRHLEERGIRFAPEEIARAFAYERSAPAGREFGFHGAFNLIRLLEPGAATDLFRTVDQGMMARSERAEILRWALAHGRLRLAADMVFRLL
jgi:hypothetical protein